MIYRWYRDPVFWVRFVLTMAALAAIALLVFFFLAGRPDQELY